MTQSTSHSNIPAKAVEAAAKGIARLNLSSKPWSGISEDVKDTFRDDARAALEAAAPYMLERAWNEGFRAAIDPWRKRSDLENPYRSQS